MRTTKPDRFFTTARRCVLGAAFLPAAAAGIVGCADDGGRDYRRPPLAREELASYETELAPYGKWIDAPDYGRSWVPANRPQNWEPYTVGHWVYTNDGWSWESDGDEANWGDITYHYGRWDADANNGWIWVPDSTYAPAWVAWRSGGGYVGWAPLPPRLSAYSSSTADFDQAISADRYVFLQEGLLGSTDISNQFVQPDAQIVGQTRNITRITRANNRVVNAGVPLAEVEAVTGTPIEALQPVRVTTTAEARRLRAQGKTVEFVPQVVGRTQQQSGTSVQTARVSQPAFRPLDRPVDQKLEQPRAEQALQQQKLDAQQDVERRAAGQQRTAAAQRPSGPVSSALPQQRDPAVQHQQETPAQQRAPREGQNRERQVQQAQREAEPRHEPGIGVPQPAQNEAPAREQEANQRTQSEAQFRDHPSREPQRPPTERHAPAAVAPAAPTERPAANEPAPREPTQREAPQRPAERPAAHEPAPREPAQREAPQQPAERPASKQPAQHEPAHEQPHEGAAPHAAEPAKAAPEHHEAK